MPRKKPKTDTIPHDAILRAMGKLKPIGRRDNALRWYPATGERCECCNQIREPSRAYPWSLWRHCNTIAHIATRYEIDATALRLATRNYRQSHEMEID